jgi:hypothetical protein
MDRHTAYSFGSRTLPFGWTWSPFLAQSTVTHVLNNIRGLLPYQWIYIDDVLFAHTDPAYLRYVVCYAVFLLESAGFIVSPKSVTTPTTEILWLGKILTLAGIKHSVSSLAAVFINLWSLRCRRCTFRSLQRTLGAIQWLASPCSLVGPWIAPSYAYLYNYQPCKIMPLAPWTHLLTAFLYLFIPVSPRLAPPPCTMAPVFTDAAIYRSSSFLVATYKHRDYASTVQVPNWVNNLQDAELYGAFHAIRQSILRGYHFICLYTDNQAAFYTILRGKVSSHLHQRSRILRRIYSMCLHHNLSLQLVLIPTEYNPADFLHSRRLIL